jgi:hypothetical protein
MVVARLIVLPASADAKEQSRTQTNSHTFTDFIVNLCKCACKAQNKFPLKQSDYLPHEIVGIPERIGVL